MSADARQALEDMLHKFVPSARLALEAADRLQAWLDDFQLSARPETPQYANPGELEEDLRLVLAALREQASPDAALIEALERAVRIAENLHGMVPRDVWRETGGDDGQGHYEGDYHAEKIRDEIDGWKRLLVAARAGETTT